MCEIYICDFFQILPNLTVLCKQPDQAQPKEKKQVDRRNKSSTKSRKPLKDSHDSKKTEQMAQGQQYRYMSSTD